MQIKLHDRLAAVTREFFSNFLTPIISADIERNVLRKNIRRKKNSAWLKFRETASASSAASRATRRARTAS
jgi:hypothetical protein